MTWAEWFRKEVHAGVMCFCIFVFVACVTGVTIDNSHYEVPSFQEVQKAFCPDSQVRRIQASSDKNGEQYYAISCKRPDNDKFYDEEYYELTIKDMSLLVEKTNKRVN